MKVLGRATMANVSKAAGVVVGALLDMGEKISSD
jgi:hypothetical protein